MWNRPHPGHSSLAIRMLARKSPACASRCTQSSFPSAFTTSSPELAIGLTPLRVDPLANPVLSLLLQTVRGAGPLPRLHRRGPIEAAAWCLSRRCQCTLPRLHRRGPIEARASPRCDRRCRQTLPRLHRRGPIEAGTPPFKPADDPRLFHGFIAVAPLKHSLCRGACGGALPLPRLHRRGPIEALKCSNCKVRSSSLPRLHRRGPIEAGMPVATA